MVTTIRSAKIQSGKFIEAIQWAVKVAMLINRKLNSHTKVARNVGGLFSEVHWLTEFENLAEYETFRDKLEADGEYQAMFKEAISQDLFVAESVMDQMYGVVPLPK